MSKRPARHAGALAVAAFLAAALATGGAAAAAAVGAWWTPAGNMLTVEATGNAEYAEDLATADVVVDVVKIADATPNENYEAFDYAFTGDFAALSLPAQPTAADWQQLAQDAAALASTTENGSGAAGAPISGLDDGLYLVLAHGRGTTADAADADADADDATTGLTADSALYRYTFAPAIVALPTKAADANGAVNTANAGAWLTEASISMKPERAPLRGSLRIIKQVPGFGGEAATFVYYLAGTTPDGKPYANYAAITCTSDAGETVVTGIPAGTVLTVEEIYEGARYSLTSGDSAEKTIVADAAVEAGAAEMASASFANAPNGSGKGGHGIQNNFELAENGDWPWTAAPVQGGSGTQE